MKNIEKYKKEIIESDLADITCCINGEIMSNPCHKNCSDCKKHVMEWLLSEYKGPILDDVEKEYLQAVIKPFGSKIKYISKSDGCCKGKQFILIEFYKGDHFIFPYFEANSMYKGMELNKEYTLKELGL